jgi:hypothetical protein
MNNRALYLAGSVVLVVIVLVDMHINGRWLAPADKAAAVASPGDESQSAGPNGTLLPKEFAFLQTRSPFGAGKARPGAKGHGGPEAAFVFKGTVQAGIVFTAFIEDQSDKNVVQAAVGDPVARGRIKSIDLDAIEYEAAGNSRRIEVGQNLNGEVVQPVPTSQPSPPPGANNGPPQMPGQPGGMPPNQPPQARPRRPE